MLARGRRNSCSAVPNRKTSSDTLCKAEQSPGQQHQLAWDCSKWIRVEEAMPTYRDKVHLAFVHRDAVHSILSLHFSYECKELMLNSSSLCPEDEDLRRELMFSGLKVAAKANVSATLHKLWDQSSKCGDYRRCASSSKGGMQLKEQTVTSCRRKHNGVRTSTFLENNEHFFLRLTSRCSFSPKNCLQAYFERLSWLWLDCTALAIR